MGRLGRWIAEMRLARLEPRQLQLPFFCGYHNEKCEYVCGSTGFYGYCWKCGVDYDPGCDR